MIRPLTPAGRAALLALLAGLAFGCVGEEGEQAPDRPPDATGESVEAPRAVTDEGFLPGAEDARLHYRVLGGAGDTIVVLHGGPGAGIGSVLQPFEPLAEHFTLIFYDQRGGGRSTLPADTSLLDARYFVADLEAVRGHFGLERMNLLTHSFGSIVAARYAETHPERIRRMVFHGAVGPDRTEAARVARGESSDSGAAAAGSSAAEGAEGGEGAVLSEGERAAFAALSEAERAALAARADTLLASLLRGTAADPVAVCREWEEIGLRLARARGERPTWNGSTCEAPPDAVRYYYRHTAQFAPRTFGDWDFTDALGHVDAPLLVIAGEEDAASLPGHRAWAAALPNGELLQVPGTGKGAITDRPELVIGAIRDFFRGAAPGQSGP